MAKNCPSKGDKNHVAAGGLGNTDKSNEYGESRQGHVVFGSGDDLEDDFLAEETTTGNKGNTSHSKADSVSEGVQVEKNNVKPKKKQGPKVVNFVG